MNPLPVRVTVKVVTGLAFAVGRLAGLRAVIEAEGESTFTLNVSTMVAAGLPYVKVTVPVRTWFGTAAAKTCEENDTLTGVPKL
jgi:phosphate/sulfate permease